MRSAKILALILVLTLLAGVPAYAAGAGAGEPDTEAADAPEEPAPASGSPAGDCIVMGRQGGRIVLEDCSAGQAGGVLVRTVHGAADVLAGTRRGAGTESEGYEVLLAHMYGAGDVLHGDFDRPLSLVLEGAELSGRVVGGTRGAWEAASDLPMEPVDPAGEAEGSEDDGKLSHGEEVWGVRMVMDGQSVWTVTGDSQLYSFTLAEGAAVRAGEGKSLAIYVDCAMDNAAAAYDAATGSRIRAFVPGVEYTGVVIRTVDEDADAGEDGDIFAALGIGTAVVDGEYSISLMELLEALGVRVTVDEATGALVIEDPDGVLEALVDGETE